MAPFALTGKAVIDGERITRDLLVDAAKGRGHKVFDAVGHWPTHLVTDDPKAGTTKLKKAQELSKFDHPIQVIDYQQFLDML